MDLSCKIDTYTAMLRHISISEIFTALQFYDFSSYFEDFVQSSFISTCGFNKTLMFDLSGIRVGIDVLEIGEENIPDFDSVLGGTVSSFDMDLITRKWNVIRLDLYGDALDNLRAVNKFDVEKHFTDYNFWLKNGANEFNVTRCDFAYDFVNYPYPVVDDLLKVCHDYTLEQKQRLRVKSYGIKGNFLPSGLSYDYRCGGQKTLNFGGGKCHRSSEMLRVYDKLLEQNQVHRDFTGWSDVYKEAYGVKSDDGSVTSPTSWFRMKLQCRNKSAMDKLFSFEQAFTKMDVMKSVFKFILEKYRICGLDGRVVPCLEQMNFDYLASILHDMKFCPYCEGKIDRDKERQEG